MPSVFIPFGPAQGKLDFSVNVDFGFSSGYYMAMLSPLFQDTPTSEPVKIREAVRVAVDFQGTKIRPLAFVWNGRKYTVKRVSMVYKRQHGTGFWWCFAVSDEANSFILLYDPIKMSWVLEEVYAL